MSSQIQHICVVVEIGVLACEQRRINEIEIYKDQELRMNGIWAWDEKHFMLYSILPTKEECLYFQSNICLLFFWSPNLMHVTWNEYQNSAKIICAGYGSFNQQTDPCIILNFELKLTCWPNFTTYYLWVEFGQIWVSSPVDQIRCRPQHECWKL